MKYSSLCLAPITLLTSATVLAITPPKQPSIAWLPSNYELNQGSVSVPYQWNMWWGKNGTKWYAYLDGKAIDSGNDIAENGNQAQSAQGQLTFNQAGKYTFKIALCVTKGVKELCAFSNEKVLNITTQKPNLDNGSGDTDIIGTGGGAGNTSPQPNCNQSTPYAAGTQYLNNSLTSNNNKTYQCLVSGWCSNISSSWAYEPGVGTHWEHAWREATECSNHGGTGNGSNNGDTGNGDNSGGTGNGDNNGGTGNGDNNGGTGNGDNSGGTGNGDNNGDTGNGDNNGGTGNGDNSGDTSNGYTQVTKVQVDYLNPQSISPLIYGYNQDHEEAGSLNNLTARRLGGNRLSTFNWENGASNSGHDGNFSNGNRIPALTGVLWNDKDTAGEVYKVFHQSNLDAGITSIITVPLLGYVAADKFGDNTTPPTSSRWKKLVYEKGSPFSLTPDTSDEFVYLDESIYFLTQTFGDATSETGVKYIALGNEPALWDSTHKYIQPEPISASEYINKVIAAAKAVKQVDPNIQVIAGDFAGISIYDLGTPEAWKPFQNQYEWFIAYFLEKLKIASDEVGYRLVDVVSIHNYPQHKINAKGQFDKNGISVKASTSTEDIIRKTRMDFPRSMWDSMYNEPSWIIGSKLRGEDQRILDRFKYAIDRYNPGTKMMIGEYDYGHDTDISHGIALSDLLGLMGQRGVEIATRWDLNRKEQGLYTDAAFQLYRNYDGNRSTYGDIALPTQFDNLSDSSVWVSQHSKTGALHVILLNKSLTDTIQFDIPLPEQTYQFNSLYGFNEEDATVRTMPFIGTVTETKATINVPKLSAYHLILK